MLITINRTYDVDWFDNWGETGWNLIENFDTLEEAVKCAKEESKKYRVRIMIVDTSTDDNFETTYQCYRGWKVD